MSGRPQEDRNAEATVYLVSYMLYKLKLAF
jgi:hypothetical protein